MVERCLRRIIVGICLCLAVSVSAFAQYGGGGTGTGTGTSTTGTKSYGSSGAAIGIGAGVAGGAVIAYLALHKASVMGCVENSSDGMKLMDEKDKKTYALVPGDADLKPGEKVELKGKKSKDTSGKLSFQVQKLAKDYGSCTQ